MSAAVDSEASAEHRRLQRLHADGERCSCCCGEAGHGGCECCTKPPTSQPNPATVEDA